MLEKPTTFRLRVLVLLLFISSAEWSSAASCGNPVFAADVLIGKWNERVTRSKLGLAWHLEKYNGLGFVRQALDGQALLFTAKVDRNGCVTRLDIKSRRADGNGYAALVAWSSLIIVTNPTLSKDQRMTVFKALGLDKPGAGGSYTTNHVNYKFVENDETNVFSAISE